MPGPQISCGFTAHPLPHNAPAKPAKCPEAEASLRILTWCHQCNGPVLLMCRRTGTDLRLSSYDILWGCASSLGEALGSFIVTPLM